MITEYSTESSNAFYYFQNTYKRMRVCSFCLEKYPSESEAQKYCSYECKEGARKERKETLEEYNENLKKILEERKNYEEYL